MYSDLSKKYGNIYLILTIFLAPKLRYFPTQKLRMKQISKKFYDHTALSYQQIKLLEKLVRFVKFYFSRILIFCLFVRRLLVALILH